jgi:hypothetical protein
MNEPRVPTDGPSSDAPSSPSLKKMPLRYLFVTLFLQPQILMVLAHDRLRRALRIMVLTGVVCGLLLGLARIAPVRGRIVEWANWFQKTTGTLVLTDSSRLEWAFPDEVPATRYNGRTRVDFMPDSAEIEAFEPRLEDDQGVWISPTEVYWWMRPEAGGDAIAQPLLVNGKLFDRVSVDGIWPDGFRLEGDEYSAKVRKWTMLTMLPGVVLSELLRVLGVSLFYTLVFAVVPYVLRSPLAARGFAGVYAFYLYAGIPPLILATVYSAVAPQWMAFDSFFVTAFILYLLFTMWKVRRAFQGRA